MLTSRNTEGKKAQFQVTIMEISVCFSWALDPYIFTLDNCNSIIIASEQKEKMILWCWLCFNKIISWPESFN